jgi:hypothetical protein
MSINQFYIIVHLAMSFFMIGLMLNIWIRYQLIVKKNGIGSRKNSNSLLYFILGLIIWEFNLIDQDLEFEVMTTIIADSLFLVAVISFSNGVLWNAKPKTSPTRYISVISILLILASHICVTNDNATHAIAYAIPLSYTLVIFILISHHLFLYYKSRKLIEIGFMCCFVFICLYATMVLPIFFSDDDIVFAWLKAMYLTFTFCLYMIFSNLSFNFLEDITNDKYFRIFSEVTAQQSGQSKDIINDEQGKPDLLKMIAADKLEEVIEFLLSSTKDDNETLTSVLILSNRLSSINTARLRETIDYDEYQLHRNKITDSVISLTQGF